MENQPQFEQPSKEELTVEIERHLELIRSWQEERGLASCIAEKDVKRIDEKIAEEYKVVEEKQKLLETLN